MTETATIGPIKAWTLAIRPKTLPAAVSPVIAGSAVAWHEGGFALGPALAALFGALMLQIASNLANDLFDHEKGADQPDRLGPTRVVSSGILSGVEVRVGLAVVLLLALCAGAYLVGVAGPVIAVIGVVSAVCALAYTGGPYPLGYHGLGEVFVFIFFGLVAVAGTAYVQLGSVPVMAWYAGVSQGALATNILVVNNLRDIEQDRRAEKRTLAVRFGEGFCVAQYATLLAVAYLMPVLLWVEGEARWFVLAPLLTLPLGYRAVRSVARIRGRGLNVILARTAQLMLLFGVLLSLGALARS
jgi:1,4-dihydroxy-2-naphthoate octaprenyltransferase